ncbi:MAG TPA: hypothetical protein PLI07_02485, partial [Candidatus Hydrogenedentes bacterium]|nr:hypothetical protein [Candidatus Hydrogenedentota bacterium]
VNGGRVRFRKKSVQLLREPILVRIVTLPGQRRLENGLLFRCTWRYNGRACMILCLGGCANR